MSFVSNAILGSTSVNPVVRLTCTVRDVSIGAIDSAQDSQFPAVQAAQSILAARPRPRKSQRKMAIDSPYLRSLAGRKS